MTYERKTTDNRLKPLQVKNETRPGFYSDGGGLYLQIGPAGTKSWVFKYTIRGKRRGMGMGPVNLTDYGKQGRHVPQWGELTLTWGSMTLAEARTEAAKLAAMVRSGIDPLEAKEAERRAKQEAQAEKDLRKTFKECAEIVIAQKADELRNAKAVAQWQSTLETYAYPFLNDGRKIDELTRHDVAKALEPIWQTKRETASRLQGRIKAVFDYAKASDAFKGDNPADFKTALEPLLGKQKKDAKEKQPALPHKQTGAFMVELRKREGMSARALEFAILTAARSGEVRGATRDEIDFDEKTWTIPASRMGKTKREHVVTLSHDAVKLLKALPRIVGTDNLLFPAPRGGELSDMTLTQLMRRMHEDETKAGRIGWIDPKSGRVAVVHGFRSAFRDWYNDEGFKHGHTREAAEIALAHTIGNAVEQAYSRSDMREARRAMMQDWANYCGQVAASNVVAMKKGAA
jgi:integrase